MPATSEQPSIADYGLISDGRGAALVSRRGSIDWCCIPRFDNGACFGRLLDWERGGFCSVEPDGDGWETTQEYRGSSMVLSTFFRGEGGEAVVHDFLVRTQHEPNGNVRLVRVIEGRRGTVELNVHVAARFDYGLVDPWTRRLAPNTYAITGGDDGLLFWTDLECAATGEDIAVPCRVREGERRHVVITSLAPADIDRDPPADPTPEEVDRWLDQTTAWWERWTKKLGSATLTRSALTLRGLVYEPTGAIVAAPTTSLPESPQGTRTWDYRYAWIRDCTFTGRSMAELGCPEEAEDFRAFISRTAAGNAEQLQVLYGIAGERMLNERELEGLSGFRGAQPVRIGNNAHGQFQLDVYGDLLEQAYRSHRRGNSPDDDQWRFLAAIVDLVVERWEQPDRGLWEWRGKPQHFTYSKAMCWTAVDRGLRLAEECMRKAPERRWRQARKQIQETVLSDGYEKRRGVFTASFSGKGLDAAVLRLPAMGIIEARDERMLSTADVIAEELDDHGLLRRHDLDDGLPGREGAFLACTFWLATCYAQQGRVDLARGAYDRASATANHLGLFAEEVDPGTKELLGNFPQGLSHLSHIEAGLALQAAIELSPTG